MSPPADGDAGGPAGDSAGTPWAGRAFRENANAADDGSAPPAFVAALTAFRAGRTGPEDVVDALRAERLLIPLVAERGETGLTPEGRTVDKSQELSIVTVAAPDGRTVLPAFSSVVAMGAWDAGARPIPTPVVRIASSAVSDGTDLVVVDPGSATEFIIRRPAVWAIARGEAWSPPHRDARVRGAFLESIASELAVADVELEPGDPEARMRGPETVVRLRILQGLESHQLDAVLGRLARRWAADDRIATLVDSLTVRLEKVEG